MGYAIHVLQRAAGRRWADRASDDPYDGIIGSSTPGAPGTP